MQKEIIEYIKEQGQVNYDDLRHRFVPYKHRAGLRNGYFAWSIVDKAIESLLKKQKIAMSDHTVYLSLPKG